MQNHDRIYTDSLFESGFAAMRAGDYPEGLKELSLAAGVTVEDSRLGEDYSPLTGIDHSSKISMAARGLLDENGEYRPGLGANRAGDPASLVLMGAEAEFKGFVERRTGESPDYRISGYGNHLGQAIWLYSQAEALGYPIAAWRLEALRLKLGSADFDDAVRARAQKNERHTAYQSDLTQEILGNPRVQQPSQPRQESTQENQGGCYIATAVYGNYDAPPVVTLRLFRDQRLASSPLGRGFIRLYYAVSPRVAKRLTPTHPVTKGVRRLLDIAVRKLERHSTGM